MATIMTNSRPPSGRVPASSVSNHAHHNLLAVPQRLPFPTTPAMPDRRARLKRLNLSITSRASVVSATTSDGGSTGEEEALLSKRAARRELDSRAYNRRHSRGRVGSATAAVAVGYQDTNLGGDFREVGGYVVNASGDDRLPPRLNLMDITSEDGVSVNSSGSLPTRE